MNNKNFEEIIERNNKEEVTQAFKLLSENICKVCKFLPENSEVDAVGEGVKICLDKIHRFHEGRAKTNSKAKAFNFFTTIILCHYRQLYRTIKNYNEIKKVYNNSKVEQ